MQILPKTKLAFTLFFFITLFIHTEHLARGQFSETEILTDNPRAAKNIPDKFISQRINGTEDPQLVPDILLIRAFSQIVSEQTDTLGVSALNATLNLSKVSPQRLKQITTEFLIEDKRKNSSPPTVCSDQSLANREDLDLHELEQALEQQEKTNDQQALSFFKTAIDGSEETNANFEKVISWARENIAPSSNLIHLDHGEILRTADLNPSDLLKIICHGTGIQQ